MFPIKRLRAAIGPGLLTALRAWITLRAVTGPHMPLVARPGPGLLGLAWVSLGFGIAFSVTWLAWLLLT